MNDKANELEVKCEICGHLQTLKGLAAWSFIILKRTLCEKCNKQIHLKEFLNEVKEISENPNSQS